ncbi:MAG TPA: hypothetical protein PKA38_04440 [Candidatus Levybacteria bacterium]|nr:hypothetical protein [Candidatus Levybacteria bacterium]
MRTKIGIILLIIAAFLMFFGGYVVVQNARKMFTPEKSASQDGLFSSLEDILTKKMSITCDYIDEEGRKTKTYIKNGKIYIQVVSINPAENITVIYQNNMVYIWDSNSATKISLPDSFIKTASLGMQQQITQGIEKYRDSCVEAFVSDAIFIPPADRKFVDISDVKANENAPTQMYKQVVDRYGELQ